MPTNPPDPLDRLDEPLDLDQDPEPDQPPATIGLLPRLPRSRRTPPASPQPPRPDENDPDETLSERSSPTSTSPNPDPEPPPAPPLVPPSAADLRNLDKAFRRLTDIAFVLLGHIAGRINSIGSDDKRVEDRWIPTVEEREFVAEPAGRIARRHMHLDQTTADTIDICLIGAGVGSYALRAGFSIDPGALTDKEPTS